MDEVERLEQRLELLSAALDEATDEEERRALRQELLDVHRRLDQAAEQTGVAEAADPPPQPSEHAAPPPSEADRLDRQVSRLAAAGLVLGLASIFLYEFVVLPLLAVAVSGAGLWTFRPEERSGLWMAIAGVVLGAIYTVASLSAGGHVQL